ncbi:MAG: hypothetical protein GYA14_12385 [Ignavibacteria bacterium]|nr:hypothetical protein [Ignavibacteria bacterium]
MLEKVVNINPGSDYKKSTGNPKYYKKVSGYQFATTSANDTLYISPATALLASLGWKIKKLNKDSEKIQILFEVDELDFEASIFVFELNQHPKIDYKVSKKIKRFAYDIIVTGFFSTTLKSNQDEIVNDIKVNGLNKFFNQFESPRFKKTSTITDFNVIETLLYDLRKEINNEFDLINNCFIKFLEKYISFKPINNIASDYEGVIIKSINIE